MDATKLHKEEIDELVSLYINGGIDDVSLKALKQWAEASDENALYVRKMVELSFSSCVAGTITLFDKEEAYNRFKTRVEKEVASENYKLRFIQSNGFKTFYRVAAVILILVLPLVGYWGGMNTVKSGFSDIVVEAPMGARTKVNLPDGTLVWLNAGSKIVYSQGFGVDDRNLKFEGEGYFEVTKNEELPFEIDTKELNLIVLGTKFNFRNYEADEEAVVNLVEGKVRLKNGLMSSADMYLSPNEKAVLTKSTGEMKKLKTDVSTSVLWTSNELYFDEVLLGDIAVQLSRSFDVDIEVADSLKGRRFYGSFKIVGCSIEEILETISSTGMMNYKFEGNQYVLF